MNRLLITLLLLTMTYAVKAQDTVVVPESPRSIVLKDTSAVISIDSFQWERKYRKNPKRAGLYAALMPGAGQIYNRQYWKLPIVYGLVGVGTGVLIHNLNNYNTTRKEVAARMSLSSDLNPDFQFLTTNQLLQQQSLYRENVDLTILLIGVGYILQVMDAVAANHLKDFDISPDISMRFKISNLPHQQIGVGVAFNFK